MKTIRYLSLLVSLTALAVVDHAYAQTTLPNPTGQANIQQFIAAVLKGIVKISLPVIALFVVYAGFKFVLAQGKEKALTEARTNIVYVLLGATLILGAWVLAMLLGNTVQQITG